MLSFSSFQRVSDLRMTAAAATGPAQGPIPVHAAALGLAMPAVGVDQVIAGNVPQP